MFEIAEVAAYWGQAFDSQVLCSTLVLMPFAQYATLFKKADGKHHISPQPYKEALNSSLMKRERLYGVEKVRDKKLSHMLGYCSGLYIPDLTPIAVL